MIGVYISAFNRMDKIQIYCPLVKNIVEKYNRKFGETFKLYLVDNASIEQVPSVINKFIEQGDIKYIRQPKNIGILGNLRSIGTMSQEDYFWILGDDDVPTWSGDCS